MLNPSPGSVDTALTVGCFERRPDNFPLCEQVFSPSHIIVTVLGGYRSVILLHDLSVQPSCECDVNYHWNIPAPLVAAGGLRVLTAVCLLICLCRISWNLGVGRQVNYGPDKSWLNLGRLGLWGKVSVSLSANLLLASNGVWRGRPGRSRRSICCHLSLVYRWN